jgi:hypothetical protein
MTYRSQAGFAIVLAALVFLTVPVQCGVSYAKAASPAHSCCAGTAKDVQAAPAACCFKPSSTPQSTTARLSAPDWSSAPYAKGDNAIPSRQSSNSCEEFTAQPVSVPSDLYVRLHQFLI